MMKETFRKRVKRIVKENLPAISSVILRPIVDRRYRNYIKRLHVVTAEVVRTCGLQVQTGPFKGMKYIDEAMHSGFTPKILGCYEAEILPAVHEAINGQYEFALDVGCAEGYYAVGFALAMPNTEVFAYDTDDECRALCCKLAAVNGVSSRVRLEGCCNHAALNCLAGHRVFLMCDCEGYEADLLDPVAVPSLMRWDILVELHECLRAGVTAMILSRFDRTHDIQLINSSHRDPRNFPVANFIKLPYDRRLAVDDLRASAQQWAWMKSRRPPDNRPAEE